mmetsp:Transcript_29673/g.78855  ORF Transcript_29673/g.78855 Transcript_29673/m.78855 type:complete len:239 (+) Transcript_29673:81-797(+)
MQAKMPMCSVQRRRTMRPQNGPSTGERKHSQCTLIATHGPSVCQSQMHSLTHEAVFEGADGCLGAAAGALGGKGGEGERDAIRSCWLDPAAHPAALLGYVRQAHRHRAPLRYFLPPPWVLHPGTVSASRVVPARCVEPRAARSELNEFLLSDAADADALAQRLLPVGHDHLENQRDLRRGRRRLLRQNRIQEVGPRFFGASGRRVALLKRLDLRTGSSVCYGPQLSASEAVWPPRRRV